MSDANSIPRVVRVSNLHGVRQVAWISAVALPILAACATYLMLHRGEAHQGDTWWAVSVGGAFNAAVWGLFIPALVLLMAGTWTADERGIEFMPYLPRLQRWTFMTWDEVRRVRWVRWGCVLVGGPRETISIPYGDLRPADRQALRARLEASLSRDFDLTLPPVPSPFNFNLRDGLRYLRRVAVATLSILAVAAALYGAGALFAGRLLGAHLALCSLTATLVAAMCVAVVQEVNRPDCPGRWRLRLAAPPLPS